MTERRFFAARDIAILLAVAVPLFAYYAYMSLAPSGAGGYAEVSVDGGVDAAIDLGRDGVYSPSGRPSVRIAVRDGAVGFVSSDCPDKICIRSGFLRIPGQSAVCLPNRVAVRVTSGLGEALDTTAY
ncbi:MAG: NusG domain II-containing protein [Synergistaceae bacterium]|nr:NusG domain II-containing protein [Synergistaceae bacterium]